MIRPHEADHVRALRLSGPSSGGASEHLHLLVPEAIGLLSLSVVLGMMSKSMMFCNMSSESRSGRNVFCGGLECSFLRGRYQVCGTNNLFPEDWYAFVK